MQIITKSTTEPAAAITGHLPEILICFSHLRWDFVFQRPQHILTGFAKQMRVFYIEEPIEVDGCQAHYEIFQRGHNLTVIVPHLPAGTSHANSITLQQALFNDFMDARSAEVTAFWYYTPMALLFSRNYKPSVTVYDCMDELSAFRHAPQELKILEHELMNKADIVFTGGQSLYEAKKALHANIYAFPSSIDKQHFAKARKGRKNNRFTLGFYGVIDERFDIELIRGIAERRPNWDIVLIGPVVKIDPASLPQLPNIVYTGPKSYAELPNLISSWNIALIPFLLNESTRFISPTKTPEYLSAGLPVISTPIKDVVSPYGENLLVQIGRDANEFIALADELQHDPNAKEWLQRVDFFLSDNSWERTCERMLALMLQLSLVSGEEFRRVSGDL